MIRHPVTVAIVTVALWSGVQSQGTPIPTRQPRRLESIVQDMFFQTQRSGSLALRGQCEDAPLGSGIASDVVPNGPEGPFRDLTIALGALSRLDRHIVWTENQEGLMRVSDDRLNGEILGIRVKEMHFDRVVTINAAIRVVMSTPEVRHHLAENHIEQFPTFPHGAPVSTEGFPVLSGDWSDLTVAQSLDRIVKFFPGLWIYSECGDGPLRRVHVRGAIVGWPAK